MNSITHTSTDQNWQDETTIYWFNVDGDEYGVADCNGEKTILDSDGSPVNTDDHKNVHLQPLVDHSVIVDNSPRG